LQQCISKKTFMFFSVKYYNGAAGARALRSACGCDSTRNGRTSHNLLGRTYRPYGRNAHSKAQKQRHRRCLAFCIMLFIFPFAGLLFFDPEGEKKSTRYGKNMMFTRSIASNNIWCGGSGGNRTHTWRA
jgi:hypothetical protein